jgi:hypothetical protein
MSTKEISLAVPCMQDGELPAAASADPQLTSVSPREGYSLAITGRRKKTTRAPVKMAPMRQPSGLKVGFVVGLCIGMLISALTLNTPHCPRCAHAMPIVTATPVAAAGLLKSARPKQARGSSATEPDVLLPAAEPDKPSGLSVDTGSAVVLPNSPQDADSLGKPRLHLVSNFLKMAGCTASNMKVSNCSPRLPL